jgi:NADH:ubiquinone oxidoreductase subunit 6 (subunit J)
MRFLKPFLIIVTFITLSLTVISSYGVANKSISPQNIKPSSSNIDLTQNPLHGDVWFAFTAIGFIGVYLAIKK